MVDPASKYGKHSENCSMLATSVVSFARTENDLLTLMACNQAATTSEPLRSDSTGLCMLHSPSQLSAQALHDSSQLFVCTTYCPSVWHSAYGCGGTGLNHNLRHT